MADSLEHAHRCESLEARLAACSVRRDPDEGMPAIRNDDLEVLELPGLRHQKKRLYEIAG